MPAAPCGCSVAQSCPTPCDPTDCSTPGLPVLHHLPELAQTHVHWVGDAIQSSHPLLPPSPLALNLSQHQRLFQWVGCLHQVGKLLELQLQQQSFQWKFRVDFLWEWLVWLTINNLGIKFLPPWRLGSSRIVVLKPVVSEPPHTLFFLFIFYFLIMKVW